MHLINLVISHSNEALPPTFLETIEDSISYIRRSSNRKVEFFNIQKTLKLPKVLNLIELAPTRKFLSLGNCLER